MAMIDKKSPRESVRFRTFSVQFSNRSARTRTRNGIYDSIERQPGRRATRRILRGQQGRQEINLGRWNMRSISFVRQQSIPDCL